MVSLKNALQLDVAKLQLGDVFSAVTPAPIPLGIPDVSTTTAAQPAPHRGIFSVYNDAGLESSSVKMTNNGHMELSSLVSMLLQATATLSIDSPMVSIGGNAALGTPAIEPAVLGFKFESWIISILTALQIWMDSHQHMTSMGPSGPASAAPTGPSPAPPVSPAVVGAVCSTKIFLA